MKTYSKYMVVIILIPIEILSVFKLYNVGLENILALWGGVYGIRLYRQFFDYERSPSIHTSPGLNISGVVRDDSNAMLSTEELAEIASHNSTALKNIKIKLLYLALTVVHIGICTYLIKFAS